MKKKLSLKDVKVQSFVTSLPADQKEKLMGGAPQLTAILGGNCVSLLGLSACNTCGIICMD